MSVSITTLQEGGYLNSHYNSTYVVTAESESIWVNLGASNAFQFNVSNPNSNTPSTVSSIVNTASGNIPNQILTAIRQVAPYLVTSVSNGISRPTTTWVEYKLTFNVTKSNPSRPLALVVHPADDADMLNVIVTTFLHANNYPLFYDNAHPRGLSGSGRYTCYKRQHYYQPWSYYTGYGNPGVVAQVCKHET